MTRSHGRKPPKSVDLAPIVDAGREYFKQHPNELLISAARRAAALYVSKHDQLAFLDGYVQARLQHDEYLRERG